MTEVKTDSSAETHHSIDSSVATNWDTSKLPDVNPIEINWPKNDVERALKFAEWIADRLCYVHAWNRWHIWDGVRWRPDEDGAVHREAQRIPTILCAEAMQIDDDDKRKRALGAAVRAGDKARLEAMISLAQNQKGVAVSNRIFDRDPFLLGVQNGVIDLRTGQFRETKRADFISKQAGVSYQEGATCPLWDKFLNRVLDKDRHLISFVQSLVGYSLTGSTKEQKLVFLYGSGRNGKSTFTEILQQLMGDYGQRAPATLYTADKHGRTPEGEIARLLGARFVIGSEVEEGSKLAESRVKDLTGQDTLVGRFLYSNLFEFKPTHKLWFFGNHKPEIRGSDLGIWRRMILIPFQVQIPESEVDKDLPAKLAAELPGILNWAIEGCLRWQREKGLIIPQVVKQATMEYRDEEDVLGEFIQDRCISEGRVEKGQLYTAFENWAIEMGYRYRPTAQQFGKRLKVRGIGEQPSNGKRYWVGLSSQFSSRRLVPRRGSLARSRECRLCC